ncbi:MAG: HEAT repeat domain-containing protein [Janthinobacterium lividum]
MKNSKDTQRRIEKHIANLGSSDDNEALHAEICLIRFGAKAIDALLNAAVDSRSQIRYRAVWALGKSREHRAFSTICSLAEDEDEAVRYDATLSLGELGDPHAIPFLEELVQRTEAEDSRHGAALSALMKLGGEPRTV